MRPATNHLNVELLLVEMVLCVIALTPTDELMLQSAFETPYVVRLHNSQTLAEALPLFTFHHPNKDGE